MGGPTFAAASPSSVAPGPRRRSTRLIGLQRRGDQDHPSSAPAPTPAPSPDEKAAVPPPCVAVPRRSPRVHLRICGLPPGPPSAPSPRRGTRGAPTQRKWIDAKVEEWAKEKAASGAPADECVLPFLQKGAPRKVECLICSKSILPEERMQCSVNHCEVTLHKACSEKRDGCCPRHICFYCQKRTSRHRAQRTMPACTECSLRQNRMIDSEDPSKAMICWSIWPSTSKVAGLADDIKNKCDGKSIEVGCTECDHNSTCESCSCRCALVSCSQACHCSVKCSNKPFSREKKIEIVKTEHCGWGAIARETIEKDDFVIEFVGEVIDDATCEARLEDMRQRRDQNFYMCKVGKDFVIDATFRGNACRFFNHSCEPNCRLETWQVNGMTRLGIFASQAIKVGMPLTYNYSIPYFFRSRESMFMWGSELSREIVIDKD
ncbi:hypothetical protein ACP70R_014959 [Stipagrostis hirtigluma subsp. patula]